MLRIDERPPNRFLHLKSCVTAAGVTLLPEVNFCKPGSGRAPRLLIRRICGLFRKKGPSLTPGRTLAREVYNVLTMLAMIAELQLIEQVTGRRPMGGTLCDGI